MLVPMNQLMVARRVGRVQMTKVRCIGRGQFDDPRLSAHSVLTAMGVRFTRDTRHQGTTLRIDIRFNSQGYFLPHSFLLQL